MVPHIEFQQKDTKGKDPFVEMGWKNFKTYDWENDDGYNNLGKWVEAAAERAKNRKI